MKIYQKLPIIKKNDIVSLTNQQVFSKHYRYLSNIDHGPSVVYALQNFIPKKTSWDSLQVLLDES